MEKGENGSTTPCPRPPVPAKKRGGAMRIFRAAMLAMRGPSSPKKARITTPVTAIVDVTVIKTIVGGMRHLHHRLDYERPPPPPPPPASWALDSYYDVHLPPPSPCSSSDGLSRYASAEDLHALDTTVDNEEEAGGDGEPNAIDMKAEEFIVMFYKEMSLQRSDSLKMIDEEEANIEEIAGDMV